MAYVVSHLEQTVTAGQLRSFLREQLPTQMLPPAFLLLDALPLTPHGEVDRRALRRMDQDVSRIRWASSRKARWKPNSRAPGRSCSERARSDCRMLFRSGRGLPARRAHASSTAGAAWPQPADDQLGA